jgi:cytidyltransferase-like protein
MIKVKVSYTGTWDLLHVGHVRALQAASKLGDELWVGVTSDEWIETFKERPVMPQHLRMEMVRALACVDHVYPQAYWTSDVEFLIEEGFSIKAIGPNYGRLHSLQLQAYQYLEKAGVRLVVIPRTPDISSTIIKERIRSHETIHHLAVSIAGDSM